MAVDLSPTISLDGSELSASWQAALIEVRCDLQLAQPGRIALRLLDPGYALLDAGKVGLGTALTVTIPGASSPLIEGEVTEVGCEQREGEQPELIVVAHDLSHRLARMTAVGTYLNSTVEQVVSQLAQIANLTPDISGASQQVDYLLQVDTNLGLIDELASRTGCDWWVGGKTLHFATPAKGTSVKLSLGSTLRSFSARATGYHADSFVVDGWNRDQQQTVTGESSEATKAVLASSQLSEIATKTSDAFGKATVVTSSVGARTQSEAKMLSQSLLDHQLASSVEAWGVADASVALQLTDVVEVANAGPLSGDYPVTALEFSYRPHRGSLMRFRCGDRRRGSVLGQGKGGGDRHRSIVSHPGLIVGLVTNINDPNNQGRVKVRFPGLSSNDESDWARLAGIGGGDNRGSVFVPEVNDEVLVGFEGGDTRLPVVIGGLYGSQSVIPTPDVSDGKVQARQIQSRLGHYFKFLDGTTSATQAIELVLAGGNNLIHLGKDKLAVQVPSGTPIDIVAGSSNITVAGSGAITIKGSSISIEADGQLELKGATVTVAATGSLSVQSDGAATLKGSTVAIQGSSSVSVVGSTVSIN